MLLKEINRNVPQGAFRSPEHTEFDDLLQEIYERKKESEANYHQQSSEKAKQINKVAAYEPAEDMRTKSLEKLS